MTAISKSELVKCGDPRCQQMTQTIADCTHFPFAVADLCFAYFHVQEPSQEEMERMRKIVDAAIKNPLFEEANKDNQLAAQRLHRIFVFFNPLFSNDPDQNAMYKNALAIVEKFEERKRACFYFLAKEMDVIWNEYIEKFGHLCTTAANCINEENFPNIIKISVPFLLLNMRDPDAKPSDGKKEETNHLVTILKCSGIRIDFDIMIEHIDKISTHFIDHITFQK